MMTRLVILWLLSEGPLHGYRIKRILDEGSLRFWFPIEVGSIYAVLRSLAKGEFIEEEIVEREGQRPERTRFRITKAGPAHFQELLRKAWSEPEKPSDPIDLALAASSELEKGELERLLSERASVLQARLTMVEKMASSAPAPEIADRIRLLTQSELDWVKTLLDKERNKNL
jgi:DNA-binding PadR family transcriptional regulator